MKILKYLLVLVLMVGCSDKDKKQDEKERWNVDVSGIGVNVEIIDISEDFYNLQFPIAEFRNKYPFYLESSYPDAEYDKQRKDTTELNIYKEVREKVNYEKIKTDLSDLFRHIKYYYPDFKEPKVFLYSSFIQDYLSPVTYVPSEGYLFLATDCFLGYGNKYYDLMEIDRYLQRTMGQDYLSSKVSKTIINELSLVPQESLTQSFVSQMIYQGKRLILTDAFLPEVPDEYKIGYTKEQIEWVESNEFQIWNYFVQNNYVFSDDLSLSDRFLSIAPFSKFYTDVDGESPGQVGSWIGWQICRKYLSENPKTDLQEFLSNTNHEEIFAKSKYKPKQIEQ